MSTRSEAAAALGRILRGGAYSNVLLREAGTEDGRMIQSMVMHALRTSGLATRVIEAEAGRSLRKIDDRVEDILRIAIGELDRGTTPQAIIVSEAVEAAKVSGAGRASGFVNGVLRSALRAGLPDLGIRDRLGVPEWLASRVDAQWGSAEAEAFWKASANPARVGLRGTPPEGASVDAVEGIPSTYLADKPIEGMKVQDPASTAVALAVGVNAGETILDIAAAPGGKTGVLQETIGDGTVVAGDIHARRLRSARRRLPDARWALMDARRLPFGDGSFDRVLFDAPCSGLGTIRRRPEILLRVTESEVDRLAGIQARGIAEALRVVRKGGRVVFSVCTILHTETVAQVTGLGATPPDWLGIGRPEGDGWLLAPHLGPTDGMFIAVLER